MCLVSWSIYLWIHTEICRCMHDEVDGILLSDWRSPGYLHRNCSIDSCIWVWVVAWWLPPAEDAMPQQFICSFVYNFNQSCQYVWRTGKYSLQGLQCTWYDHIKSFHSVECHCASYLVLSASPRPRSSIATASKDSPASASAGKSYQDSKRPKPSLQSDAGNTMT